MAGATLLGSTRIVVVAIQQLQARHALITIHEMALSLACPPSPTPAGASPTASRRAACVPSGRSSWTSCRWGRVVAGWLAGGWWLAGWSHVLSGGRRGRGVPHQVLHRALACSVPVALRSLTPHPPAGSQLSDPPPPHPPPPCLQIKVTSLSQQNSRLVSHVALVEGQKAMLAQQVGAGGGRAVQGLVWKAAPAGMQRAGWGWSPCPGGQVTNWHGQASFKTRTNAPTHPSASPPTRWLCWARSWRRSTARRWCCTTRSSR